MDLFLLAIQTSVIIASVIAFFAVIILLVVLLLYIKAKLTPQGKVKININDGEKILEVDRSKSSFCTW